MVQFAIEHCLPWLLLGFYHRSTASSTTVHALVGRTFGGTTAVADGATALQAAWAARDAAAGPDYGNSYLYSTSLSIRCSSITQNHTPASCPVIGLSVGT
eukprot:COSAG06_NODE_610_length_13844_cov_14.456359_5_plen_100_part_00